MTSPDKELWWDRLPQISGDDVQQMRQNHRAYLDATQGSWVKHEDLGDDYIRRPGPDADDVPALMLWIRELKSVNHVLRESEDSRLWFAEQIVVQLNEYLTDAIVRSDLDVGARKIYMAIEKELHRLRVVYGDPGKAHS